MEFPEIWAKPKAQRGDQVIVKLRKKMFFYGHVRRHSSDRHATIAKELPLQARARAAQDGRDDRGRAGVDLTLPEPEDNATTVDTEAGGLGVPFTQQEHEEEWVNWVPWADWGQVEAQMGGAGSS